MLSSAVLNASTSISELLPTTVRYCTGLGAGLSDLQAGCPPGPLFAKALCSAVRAGLVKSLGNGNSNAAAAGVCHLANLPVLVLEAQVLPAL